MKRKNNSPIDIFDKQQLKLNDYFDDLPETSYRKDYINDKLEKIDNNLSISIRKGKYYIK